MTDAAATPTSLDEAARRLTAAVEALEGRLGFGSDATGDLFLGSAFDQDRQRLASELDHAQARVRRLEEAAREAADAVDAAVAEIRGAMASQAAASPEETPSPETEA